MDFEAKDMKFPRLSKSEVYSAIEDYLFGDVNLEAICRQLDISKQRFFRMVELYKQDKETKMEVASEKPHTFPGVMASKLTGAVAAPPPQENEEISFA